MVGDGKEQDDIWLFYQDLIESIPLRYSDVRETIESQNV